MITQFVQLGYGTARIGYTKPGKESRQSPALVIEPTVPGESGVCGEPASGHECAEPIRSGSIMIVIHDKKGLQVLIDKAKNLLAHMEET